MQITQINPNTAERVLVTIKNVDGSGSMTTGMGACLVQTGVSCDGVQAVKSTVALSQSFYGVALKDIAINSFGLLTAWGYAASVMISNVGTSITITAGNTFKASAVAGMFFSSIKPENLSNYYFKYITAIDTQTISAQVWHQGLVRAL